MSTTVSLYDRIRSNEGLKAELEGLRERISGTAAILDSIKKDSATTLETARKELAACAENMRKDAAALEVVKERVSNLEAIRKELAGIETLRERLSTLAADLKATREEMIKIQQEIEKNKIGDMERKVARDAQYRQVEETLKELQKGLQDSREKLARLEGMQPVMNVIRLGEHTGVAAKARVKRAPARQRIDVRRPDVARPVSARGPRAVVVGHEEDHVRPGRGPPPRLHEWRRRRHRAGQKAPSRRAAVQLNSCLRASSLPSCSGSPAPRRSGVPGSRSRFSSGSRPADRWRTSSNPPGSTIRR